MSRVATALCWLLLLPAAAPAGEAEGEMSYVLPAEPKATVICWQATGPAAEAAPEPDLVVRADGTVTVGSRLAGGRPVEGRLPAARLDGLLRFVIDQNAFFDFDPVAIAAALEGRPQPPATAAAGEALAVPLGPPYLDAGTTRLAVRTADRRHAVSWHGLFAAARDHPDNQALARLRAIELRLLELAQEIAAADR